jgi:hypothetical protein
MKSGLIVFIVAVFIGFLATKLNEKISGDGDRIGEGSYK